MIAKVVRAALAAGVALGPIAAVALAAGLLWGWITR
jgi:hypothetical protein